MNERKQEFVQGLDKLVHTRTNRKDLERSIRNLLPPRTHVCFGWNIEQLSTDYEMCFEVQNDNDYHGFYSVYYLQMIRKNCLANGYKERFYITEVGCEM